MVLFELSHQTFAILESRRIIIMIGIDKIPIDKLTEGEDGSFAYLDKDRKPLLIISRDEYANAERINQCIDAIRELQDMVGRLMLK